MKKHSLRHDNIHSAFDLNSDVNTIIEYYAEWSKTYDKDVIDGYVGLDFIANLMDKYLRSSNHQEPYNPAAMRIADVGCGTGIGGASLNKLGYSNLDGIDISQEMIKKAAESGLYKELFAGENINEPLASKWNNQYDASISLGVFTPGHVLPEALYQLIQMTKPSGYVVVSTRPEYYDTTDYQAINDHAISSGIVELKRCYKDAPYRNDGDAHYWVYKVK